MFSSIFTITKCLPNILYDCQNLNVLKRIRVKYVYQDNDNLSLRFLCQIVLTILNKFRRKLWEDFLGMSCIFEEWLATTVGQVIFITVRLLWVFELLIHYAPSFCLDDLCSCFFAQTHCKLFPLLYRINMYWLHETLPFFKSTLWLWVLISG